MKIMIFALALALVLIASCTAQQPLHLKTSANDNTLLWQVSGKGLAVPSYLFGTFHLICRDDIPIGDQLKQAVQSVNEIYMELDMDDPSTMIAGMKYVNMGGDSSLKSLYSDSDYKKIDNFFRDSLQMPLVMFQKMKPVFLEALLYPKLLSCKTSSGVEEELLKLARADKKQVQGLETIAFQASVFGFIPYTDQAKELLQSIDSLQQYKKYFNSMVQAYKNQQLKKLEELMNNDDFSIKDNKDVLLTKRNVNWVIQLHTIMKKEAVFVAVGAGHLVGEQGLIALLRKEGYTVTPIEN